MKILRMLLAGLAGLLLVLLVVALATDLNFLARPLADWASRQAGLPVAIDGGFSLRLGRTVALSAGSVRVGAADDGDRLAVERLVIEVDGRSIFSRPLVVNRVVIEGAELQLQVDPESADRRDERFRWPETLPLVIDEITIARSRLLLEALGFSRPLDVRLENIRQKRDSQDMLALDGDGQVNGVPLQIRGQVGRFDQLVRGRDFSLDLGVLVGDLQITAKAYIDDLANPSGSTVDLQLKAPDADYLRSSLGIENLGTGPVALEGKVTPAESGRGVRASLSGSIGEFSLDATGELAEPGKMAKLALDLDLSGPDLGLAGGLLGFNKLPHEPFRLTAAVDRSGDVFKIPSAKLVVADSSVSVQGDIRQFSSLSGNDIRFQVEGQDIAMFRQLLDMPGLAQGAFRISGRLRQADPDTEMLELDATTSLGNLQAKGKLGPYPDYIGTTLEIRVAGDNLAGLGKAADLAWLPPLAFKADADIAVAEQGVTLSRSTLRIGEETLGLKGRVGWEPAGPDTDLQFDVSGSKLQSLLQSTGARSLPAGGYRVQGRLRRKPGASLLDDLKATLAGANLELDGRIGDDPAADADVKLDVSGRELSAFAGLLSAYGVDAATLPLEGPFNARGRLRRKPGSTRLDDATGLLAGARFKLSGRIADVPATGTDLEFDVTGPRLENFAGLFPGVDLPDGRFTAAGTASLTRDNLVLSGLDLSAGGARASVDLNLALPLGTSTGRFDIQASGPDLSRLLPPDRRSALLERPFDLSARGSASRGKWVFDQARFAGKRASISGKGTLDWQPDFSATNFHIDAQARSLADLGAMLGKDWPDQALQLAADISGTPDALVVRDASGMLGGSDFAGQATVKLQALPQVEVSLDSRVLDLRPFLGDAQSSQSGATDKPAVTQRRGRKFESKRLISPASLPLDWMDGFEGSFKVRAGQVLATNLALRDLDMEAAVKAGGLRVQKLEMRALPEGRLVLVGELTRARDQPGKGVLQVTARTERLPLSLPADSPEVAARRPRADLELDLSGRGETWRELAGTLNGRASLQASAGELPGVSGSGYFTSLRSTLVSLISPGARADPVTRLSCMVVFTTVKDGIAETVPAMVLQTDKLNMFTRGTVNLGTEVITAQMRVQPRKQIDISLVEITNPDINVTGTLADPKFGLNATSTLITGGAAVATAGLSIVARSVWDRISRAKDPCAAAAEEARRIQAGEVDARRKLLPSWLLRPFGGK